MQECCPPHGPHLRMVTTRMTKRLKMASKEINGKNKACTKSITTYSQTNSSCLPTQRSLLPCNSGWIALPDHTGIAASVYQWMNCLAGPHRDCCFRLPVVGLPCRTTATLGLFGYSHTNIHATRFRTPTNYSK